MRRTWIDLNSDMGESFGNFVLGRPEEVMKRISHANIACGFHAGDPSIIRRTCVYRVPKPPIRTRSG